MKRQRRLIPGKEDFGPKSVALISDETSPVERLMQQFETHETAEAVFVRKYKEMLRTATNPLVKCLIELIVADEEKHQQVLHAMTSRLKASLDWTQPKDATESADSLGGQKDNMLKLTQDFIDAERKEIEQYRSLAQASKKYYQGLFTAFLAAMIHDSEKHVEILEFLRKKLKAA